MSKNISDKERLCEVIQGKPEQGDYRSFLSKSVAGIDAWINLMELSDHKEPKVAFRAAYALEIIYFTSKEEFDKYLEIFLERYICVSNRSAHRHFTKIMNDVILRHRLTRQQEDQIAEKSFDLLIDPHSRVGVKAHCMDILATLSTRIDWVKEALEQSIIREVEKMPTPGMQSRAKKVLTRLQESQY